MTEVSRLPQTGIILDLDAEERPASEVKPPFVVQVGGRAVTFADPANLDWKDLAAIEVPADLIHVSLSKEDRRFLFDLSLETWRFNKLMQTYYDYYELEEKIAQARRREQLGGLGR